MFYRSAFPSSLWKSSRKSCRRRPISISSAAAVSISLPFLSFLSVLKFCETFRATIAYRPRLPSEVTDTIAGFFGVAFEVALLSSASNSAGRFRQCVSRSSGHWVVASVGPVRLTAHMGQLTADIDEGSSAM